MNLPNARSRSSESGMMSSREVARVPNRVSNASCMAAGSPRSMATSTSWMASRADGSILPTEPKSSSPIRPSSSSSMLPG